MQIIPAIDLKGGKCVRLRQGEFTQVETYADDPVKYAMRWQAEGATRLHIVDLDGARIGTPHAANLDVVRQIMRRVTIPIQLGGGIRTAETVERMFRIPVLHDNNERSELQEHRGQCHDQPKGVV